MWNESAKNLDKNIVLGAKNNQHLTDTAICVEI